MKKLFLLDGMALAYRAHFAFMSRPIYSSKGMNTSALYGFTATLIDLITSQKPTHLAIAFDTPEPTERHKIYEPYKANRDKMPEDLAAALPHLSRIAEAFKVPVLRMPGYEADDIIGTLATRAEKEDFETFMVTPDKDFGQLVTDRIFMYRPSYKGEPPEIQDPKAVCDKWGIERTAQVIDILGLSGDASDNIPGVPGVGPKTAQKLLERFGSLEGVLQNTRSTQGQATGEDAGKRRTRTSVLQAGHDQPGGSGRGRSRRPHPGRTGPGRGARAFLRVRVPNPG